MNASKMPLRCVDRPLWFGSGVWLVHVEPSILLKPWTHNTWKHPCITIQWTMRFSYPNIFTFLSLMKGNYNHSLQRPHPILFYRCDPQTSFTQANVRCISWKSMRLMFVTVWNDFTIIVFWCFLVNSLAPLPFAPVQDGRKNYRLPYWHGVVLERKPTCHGPLAPVIRDYLVKHGSSDVIIWATKKIHYPYTIHVWSIYPHAAFGWFLW